MECLTWASVDVTWVDWDARRAPTSRNDAASFLLMKALCFFDRIGKNYLYFDLKEW